ncbi:MAG: hypothetical protein QXK74_00520 [Candidatus Nitrosocaldaceae archaeon]
MVKAYNEYDYALASRFVNALRLACIGEAKVKDYAQFTYMIMWIMHGGVLPLLYHSPEGRGKYKEGKYIKQ